MAATADPFSLLYDTLMGMLQSHDGLTALVRPGNMISFSTAKRDPMKASIAAADLPELRLTPNGGQLQYHGPSGKYAFSKRFNVEVATGEQRLTEPCAIYPVQWEVYRALSRWLTVFPTVLYDGAAFLVSLLAFDAQEGVTNTDLNRGIRGWSAVLGCEVAGFLPVSKIIPQ